MRANLHSLSPHQPQRERAFTITELLVVVAVIALLLTLRLSAVASAKDQTLRAQCAGHMRTIALATTIIANDSNDKFPVNTLGNWAWDMSWNVGNMLTQYVSIQSLNCPASGLNYDDYNRLWSYLSGGIHVIGYAQTFSGTADVNSSNYNATLTPQRIATMAFPSQEMPAPLASQRVLFADATISAPGQANPSLASTYNWIDIVGGYPKPSRTSHMDGALPAGGNLAMLDGHVEWRSFSLMAPRSPNSGQPVFWW